MGEYFSEVKSSQTQEDCIHSTFGLFELKERNQWNPNENTKYKDKQLVLLTKHYIQFCLETGILFAKINELKNSSKRLG